VAPTAPVAHKARVAYKNVSASFRYNSMNERSELTAGLNKPPEIRKKIHTFTIKLNPNETEMYSMTIGLNPAVAFVVVDSLDVRE
jgi:hypothetical protein